MTSESGSTRGEGSAVGAAGGGPFWGAPVQPPPRDGWGRETRRLLEAALWEDLGAGDVTTARVVPVGLLGRARIVAREGGVLAGSEVAAWIFHRLDPSLRIERPLGEGERFEAGGELLRISGRVAPILTAERAALNFLQRLCGVATLTRSFVEAVAGTGARIFDTRKTTPGWRELERAAVRCGGGANHRSGLFDAILLKENHLRAAGGVVEALRAARAGAPEPAFLEIEVRDRGELAEALAAGARMLLLDNFALPELAAAVREVRVRAPETVLEASGGVTLANVREVAATGVDRISVGAITHSARALDLSLLLEEVEGGGTSGQAAARGREA
jgi:nicotinate-nucleotide pyrophosphorylase (carboxylating)